MTAALEARGLVKHFGHIAALDGFDLDVAEGEICGLVGHNGAGKTTFARVVAGLLAPESGVVRVTGVEVARDPRRARRYLGVAPQELALYPTATGRENLLLFAGLYGLDPRAARERIEGLAESMALAEVLDRRVRVLSGGQQRRLQAATAMLHQPTVLILDEPTVGADPITRESLLAVVRDLANGGTAVVYTTHYLPELDVLDATLAVADHGHLIARGDRATLLHALPGHAVLEFADGSLDVSRLPTIAGELHVQGREVTVTADDVASVVGDLLASHPDLARGLRSVDVRPPSLDDLYHHLVVTDART